VTPGLQATFMNILSRTFAQARPNQASAFILVLDVAGGLEKAGKMLGRNIECGLDYIQANAALTRGPVCASGRLRIWTWL